jgi:hypothetical protein
MFGGEEYELLTIPLHILPRLRMHGATYSPMCLHALSFIIIVPVILVGVEEAAKCTHYFSMWRHLREP